ncbi:mitochondrial carrier [Dacryopinax primogenitus]|uniref:Mitochondrial carrier n=1 Tax=Dacryopinax primogenitus (strain DJM 731) TaxID=1858805 RepID=M5GGD5_DACPD|nr:mitochondrial carrier [Dacryopinax primogenitus]EJU05298.1 mitochondrial carrier [Dacryopinax primogenitus]
MDRDSDGSAAKPGPISPYRWDSKRMNDGFNYFLLNNRTAVCATVGSLVSTLLGFPLDSLKSRLQAARTPVTPFLLATNVFREEGIGGFFRGVWIPLLTISIVRTASFTIYSGTKEYVHRKGILAGNSLKDVAFTGAVAGAASGSSICFGSAPFEIVKVRRQLEYAIAQARGLTIDKPPGTWSAVMQIVKEKGVLGLYQGFRMHFIRDTMGTSLYFLEYDSFRYLMGRSISGEQGPPPSWLPVPTALIPFFCGSVAGVTSWAIIYPVDVVKTKIQQRALANQPYRTVWVTFQRLIRGPDAEHPRPLLVGIGRLYRGLGISAIRSCMTHGALWLIFDWVAQWIDQRTAGMPGAGRGPVL